MRSKKYPSDTYIARSSRAPSEQQESIEQHEEATTDEILQHFWKEQVRIDDRYSFIH